MKNETILGIVSLLMLLFLALPSTSAHIGIIDIGFGYDGDWHYGYVDYQNTVDYNVSGAILVFIDGDIVAGKILDMPIRYVTGFRCSPIKTLEFPLERSKGNHTIVVYALSQNVTAQHGFEYTMAGWEDKEAEEETEFEEEVEDWLICGGCS